jgi:hypothetical protein
LSAARNSKSNARTSIAARADGDIVATLPLALPPGQATLPLPVDPALQGLLLHAQALVVAPVNAFGLALSNRVTSLLSAY